MKILITGGAGFIGSHLAARLLERGDDVCALDDLSAGSFANIDELLETGRFCFMKGSVLDAALVDALAAGNDAVFHLAAAVGIRKVLADPAGAYATNAGGTAVVLSAAARRGKPIVFASSSEVYGPRPRKNGNGLREDDAAPPEIFAGDRWAYAASKLAGETRARELAREAGLRFTAVRLFNTIGPRQSAEYGMVVPRFVRQALAGQPLTVFGDGRQTRSFTWVGDTVECLVRLLECPASAGRAVNVGSREEISILELAQTIKATANSASPIRFVPYGQAYGRAAGRDFEDIRRRRPDTALLESLIHIAPQTPLRTTLDRIIAWASPAAGCARPRLMVDQSRPIHAE